MPPMQLRRDGDQRHAKLTASDAAARRAQDPGPAALAPQPGVSLGAKRRGISTAQPQLPFAPRHSDGQLARCRRANAVLRVWPSPEALLHRRRLAQRMRIQLPRSPRDGQTNQRKRCAPKRCVRLQPGNARASPSMHAHAAQAPTRQRDPPHHAQPTLSTSLPRTHLQARDVSLSRCRRPSKPSAGAPDSAIRAPQRTRPTHQRTHAAAYDHGATAKPATSAPAKLPRQKTSARAPTSTPWRTAQQSNPPPHIAHLMKTTRRSPELTSAAWPAAPAALHALPRCCSSAPFTHSGDAHSARTPLPVIHRGHNTISPSRLAPAPSG